MYCSFVYCNRLLVTIQTQTHLSLCLQKFFFFKVVLETEQNNCDILFGTKTVQKTTFQYITTTVAATKAPVAKAETKTPAAELSSNKTPAAEVSSNKTPAAELSSNKTPAAELSSNKTPAAELSSNISKLQ